MQPAVGIPRQHRRKNHLETQLVGAFGEKIAEAELFGGWLEDGEFQYEYHQRRRHNGLLP